MHFFLRYFSLTFVLLLFNSCSILDQLEIQNRDDNAINLYNYYLNHPQYRYKVTNNVQTVDTITLPIISPSKQWIFGCFYEGEYDCYDSKKVVTVDSISMDTLIFYTESISKDNIKYDYQDPIQKLTIKAIDGLPISNYLHFPVPSKASILASTFIKMDDGTICFRTNNGAIYSSTLGLLCWDKSEPEIFITNTLVQINTTTSIPHLIHEFIAKEKYLALQK